MRSRIGFPHLKCHVSVWTVPVFLGILIGLSFGIFLPELGFYWDDWAKIFVYRLQGAGTYWLYYVGDRPLSAWTHILLTPILGVTPLPWQIFTLSMRFFSALFLYYLLVLLKGENRLPAAMAAAIFVVYPLFSQQPIAVTFHQQWMQFAFIIASFDCMLLSVRSSRHKSFWTGLAVILSLLQLSITEYFAPLDLIRPFILWFAFDSEAGWKKKSQRVFKTWLPYLVVIILFFIWRMFIMPLPIDVTYQTGSFFSFFTNPVESFTQLAKTVVVDLSYIFVGSWAPVFQTRITHPISLTYLVILIISAAAGALAILYFARFSQPQTASQNAEPAWWKMAFIIGLAGALLGPFPAWATQSQVLFDGHSDRYSLPALFGLSILTAGIIEWLGRSRLQRAVLAGLIITLACGFQLRNGFDYQKLWRQQMRLYWQLYWRAPQLKAQTAVYSENELIPNQGLFSISAALNQLYPQNSNDQMVDFWFYTLRPKYNAGAPKSFSISNDSTFRTLHFIGSSPDTLLIHQDPSHGNCLWVLRPEDQWNPYLSDITLAMLPISNLERISPQAAAGYPPAELFGKEPSQEWCFAFEKAELAWQFEDWQRITQIGDDLLEAGFNPGADLSNSPREWWPFIIGYARDGQVRTAIDLSQQSLQQDKRYHAAICGLWQSMNDVPEVGVGLSELGCSQAP